MTISLPKGLRRGLEKMAKAEGVTNSDHVRRALKADIFRRALRAARQIRGVQILSPRQFLELLDRR